MTAGVIKERLSELEMVLLRLVEKGGGRWGWHQLASQLSRVDVPRQPDMMSVLKKLAAEGLLVRHVIEGSPNDRWELTEPGKQAIASPTPSETP